MKTILEIMSNPIVILILVLSSVIGIIAVILYLDNKQQEDIDKMKTEIHWQYQAIMTLAKVIKENEKGYFDFEEFYNDVQNK